MNQKFAAAIVGAGVLLGGVATIFVSKPTTIVCTFRHPKTGEMKTELVVENGTVLETCATWARKVGGI